MKPKLLMLMFLLISPNVIAGGSVVGKITKVRVDHPSGQVMIFFDTDVSISGANCRGGSYKNVLAVDASTAGGKAALSTALTAKASSSTVQAGGKLNCTVYGNGVAETLDYMVIQ